MAKLFSKEHEWVEVDGDTATVGISDYAQKALGDIVYVSQVAESGDEVSAGDDVAEIESVKSVSIAYAPLSGEIIEFNSELEDEENSKLLNEDPYGKGWIFKIKLSDESELENLMSEADYNSFIETL